MLTKQRCSTLAQRLLQGSLYKAYLTKMLNDFLQRSLDMLPLTSGQTMLLNRNPWKLYQTQLFSNCSKDTAQKLLLRSSCRATSELLLRSLDMLMLTCDKTMFLQRSFTHDKNMLPQGRSRQLFKTQCFSNCSETPQEEPDYADDDM